MSAAQIIAAVLLTLGVALGALASVGLVRFDNVLARMHASSKPQTLGLLLVLAGAAVAVGSWPVAGMLLLVLLAQMTTVPVASSLVGRAAFHRGFVRGGEYAIDELTPRLIADEDAEGDDDLEISGGTEEPGGELEAAHDLPANPLVPDDLVSAARTDSNWDETDEPAPGGEGDGLDIDLSGETEREAVELSRWDAEAGGDAEPGADADPELEADEIGSRAHDASDAEARPDAERSAPE